MDESIGVRSGLQEHTLEEPESPCQADVLLSLLPTADDLSCRLKPKLLQDPLLDGAGQPYTHTGVFRSDFHSDTSSEAEDMTIPTISVPWEKFAHERLHHDEDEIDLVLELPVSTVAIPGTPESEATMPALPLPAVPSPHRDLMEVDQLQEQSADELQALVSEATVTELPSVEELKFSPAEKLKLGAIGFSKLNDADVSHDSDDSGIAVSRALLESPCLHLTSSPISTPLAKQLAALEPFPLSPDGRLVLMSPSSENKFMRKIREKDNTFDSILALTIPYPDVEGLPAALTTGCVATEALFLLSLDPAKLDGDFELELPWDPLAESYRQMSLAQRQLDSASCSEGREAENEMSVGCAWREDFKSESSVKAAAGEDFQMHLDPERASVPQEADVPSLKSANPLPGYSHAKRLESTQEYKRSSPQATNVSHKSSSGQHGRSSLLPSSSRKEKPSTLRRLRPNASPLSDLKSSFSSLEAFILLRSGPPSPSPGVKRKSDTSSNQKGEPAAKKAADAEEEAKVSPPRITSPTFQDICLTGEFQTVLLVIGEHAAPLIHLLKPFGLQAPHGFQDLPVDTMKFFLRQQQNALGNCQEHDRDSLHESCQLAASLYTLGSLAETLMHCSLDAALERFSALCQRYEDLIRAKLDPLRQELLKFKLRVRERSLVHPKLHKLACVVTQWMNQTRRGKGERAVVLVEREFSTLSGEILDLLQTIPGLKCCVFSFLCNDAMDPLYLETLEERFYHYDCLVAPGSSIAGNFPWEKVSLLVEFEEGRSPPFPAGDPPENARLRQYIILRTVKEISASALASSDAGVGDLSSVQYVFIASENVIQNGQLLQLLEARFNIVVVPRDYSELKRNAKKSMCISYADLILDQSTGIVVRPLSLLSTDIGLKTLVNATNALSLQYERCWVVLYAQPEISYPYGGSVPVNLARLHASVAHYSPSQHHYQVKVLCASGPEEAIRFSRRIAEETHRTAKAWSGHDWTQREWIAEDMSKQEKFLLSFPCLNSFSAQLLLRGCTVAQLLVLDERQLQVAFPWLPVKVIKLFHKLCNLSCSRSQPKPLQTTNSSALHHQMPPFPRLDAKHLAPGHTDKATSTLLERVLGRRIMEESSQGLLLSEGMFVGPESAHAQYSTENAPIVLSSGDDQSIASEYTAGQDHVSIQVPTNLSYGGYSIDTGEMQPLVGGGDPFQHEYAGSDPFYQNLYPVSHPEQPTLPTFEEWQQQQAAVRNSGSMHHSVSGSSLAWDNPGPTMPPAAPLQNPKPLHGNLTDTCQKSPEFELSVEPRSSLQQLQWSPLQSMARPTNSEDPASGNLSTTSVDPSNLAAEYYGTGAVSSRYVAGDRVKRTPGTRIPVKSLDLGFDNIQAESIRPTSQLCGDDRAVADTSSAPEAESSYPANVTGLLAREVPPVSQPLGLLDLKSFHSQEKQQMSRGHTWESISLRSPGMHSGVSNTQFQGLVGFERVSRPKRQHGDYQVPSSIVSPPSGEASFYGPPNTGTELVRFSPARKKRLVYERVPGSMDGQTRLTYQ